MSAATATLLEALWPSPPVRAPAALRRGVLAVAGICALTVSAKVQIPFYPVPLTLQTLVVLLLGMSYGMRLACATVAGYLLCGVAGAPVFAAGGGLAYFAGPTGGYLAGFLIAAAAMGYMGDRGWGKSARSMIVPMLLGTALLFVPGVAWLAYLFGMPAALANGLTPFLLGEAVKIAVAIPLVPGLWRIAQKKS